MKALAFLFILLAGPAFAQGGMGPGPGMAHSIAGAHSIAFSSLSTGGSIGGASIAGGGTYVGTTPTSISTATWGGTGCAGSSAVGGFSASSGTWSAAFAPPGSGTGGSCNISITDNLGAGATSPNVTVTGNAITFPTLANGAIGGSTIAGSGAYTGVTPTSISTATWGGTGCAGSSTVTGFTAGSLAWSANFSTPVSGAGGSACNITITNNLGAGATSPNVTLSNSGMTFTALANGYVGGITIPGSGTYSGTTPSSISSATWGGSCSGSATPSNFSASGGKWTARFTTPAGVGTGCTLGITNDLSSNATSPGVTISGASSTWAVVANADVAGSSGGTTAALNTTGAKLIVACVSFNNPGAFSNATVTDNKGNTYVKAGTTPVDASVDNSTALFYKISPTVGTGHTFSISAQYSSSQVIAFSDSAGTPVYDQLSGDKGTGTTLQAGPITPGANNSLVIQCNSSQALLGVSIDGGFSIANADSFLGATYYSGAAAYYFQPAATAINPTWSGLSTTSAAGTMSFKP